MNAIIKEFAAFPRQGNFEEKRALILREAARLFVEKGVHETSLSEVARNFGMSKPALYHYARSKDDIIAQILRRAGHDNRALLDGLYRSSGSGLDKLKKGLAVYGRALGTEFGRCLATIQPSTFSPATQRLHRRIHRILLDGMADIVAAGIEDGSIRACQPRIAVLAVLHALNGTARWYRADGSLGRDEVNGEIVDAFVRGIERDAGKGSR